MRWLASLPRWFLVSAFVLLLLGVVLGQMLSIHVLSGVAVVALFLVFFPMLMALVARRETPRPPSPH